MPIEPGELVEAVEEIQQQENDAEQHDAAADKTMAQITEQFDPRFDARTCAPADTINVPIIIFST